MEYIDFLKTLIKDKGKFLHIPDKGSLLENILDVCLLSDKNSNRRKRKIFN